MRRGDIDSNGGDDDDDDGGASISSNGTLATAMREAISCVLSEGSMVSSDNVTDADVAKVSVGSTPAASL